MFLEDFGGFILSRLVELFSVYNLNGVEKQLDLVIDEWGDLIRVKLCFKVFLDCFDDFLLAFENAKCTEEECRWGVIGVGLYTVNM
jgi:hypothetical protein